MSLSTIDLPCCSPFVGQYKINSHKNLAQKLPVNEVYDDFGAHFSIFKEKNLHRSCHSAHDQQLLGGMFISINAWGSQYIKLYFESSGLRYAVFIPSILRIRYLG